MEETMQTTNQLLRLAGDIRSRTYGMCRVGPGPYGFGVSNNNPARIGLFLNISPNPYDGQASAVSDSAVLTVTVEAFEKGTSFDKMLSIEDIRSFRQDKDPATCAVAKAILTISGKPIQISKAEYDEAFHIMACQDMEGVGITSDEARQLARLKWYRGKSPEEIVSFQMFQKHICMPFQKYRKALEQVLGRPVQIQEFNSPSLLQEEYMVRNRELSFSRRKAAEKQR